MIFLSIFICFYLFFFRRQRRNFLYLTHVKTSSCGTIERIERKSRLARRVGECPAGRTFSSAKPNRTNLFKIIQIYFQTK